LIDSGGSADRAFGMNSVGLDLGWINFSSSYSGESNIAQFGIFGAESQKGVRFALSQPSANNIIL
jgi:hypothetical protein